VHKAAIKNRRLFCVPMSMVCFPRNTGCFLEDVSMISLAQLFVWAYVSLH